MRQLEMKAPWRDRAPADLQAIKAKLEAFDSETRSDARLVDGFALLLAADWDDMSMLCKAHDSLCRALADDLLRTGFTFEGVPEVVYGIYEYLTMNYDLEYDHGEWRFAQWKADSRAKATALPAAG